MKLQRLFLYILILSTAITIATALVMTKKTPPPQPKKTVAVVVDTLQVHRQTLHPEVHLVGRLRPSQQAELRYEVSARLIKRHVNPGQVVKKGDLLLELDDSHYQQIVAKSEALSAQEKINSRQDDALWHLAQETVQLQIQEVSRLQNLNKKGLISASALDQAKRALLQKRTEATRLQYSVEKAPTRKKALLADLNRARIERDKTRLLAPFSGTINSVSVVAGDFISKGQSVISLVNTNPLELPLKVGSTTVSQLSLQQTVSVQTDNKKITGTVYAIQSAPDPATLTHNLVIRLDGKALTPGEQASAILLLNTLEDVLAIPETAILREQNDTGNTAFVFMLENGLLHKVPVQIGQRVKSLRVIESGLAEGDTIVAKNVAAMSDGLLVQRK